MSLPRQQSAMLPLLDEPIEATRVSIYNERVHAKHPLNGLKIKNATKQALMQGPVTIYDGEQYAGDARLMDLQPGEDRYLSYAIDTGVEVKPFDRVAPGPEMTVKVEGGRLQVQYKLRQTRTYAIANRSPEARSVVLEQPVRDGWQFAKAAKFTREKADADWKAGADEKPAERTRDQYRFVVAVGPGETVKYEVSEDLPRVDPFETSKHTDWSGFATSLGLDVWTDSRRTPDDKFAIEVVPNALKITHKDKRTTTYFVRNKAGEDKTVWLEHAVPAGRKLLGDAKPVAADANRYRFKMELGHGKTLQQAVVEEAEDTVTEAIPKPAPPASAPVGRMPAPPKGWEAEPGAEEPADRFVTELGFDVWTTAKATPEEFVGVRFAKDDLVVTAVERATETVHVRNKSGRVLAIDLEHRIHRGWTYAGTEAPVEAGRYRFALKVPADGVVKQAVAEQRTLTKPEPLAGLTDERIKKLLESKGVSDKAKEAVKKSSALRAALEQTRATLAELKDEVKAIGEEQARIRQNLEKLPQTSDVYKRFLEKIDKQETLLEKAGERQAAAAAREKEQKKEYEAFVAALDGK